MNEEELKKIHQRFQTVAIAVSLFFTIGGVGVGILNYYVITQLQPVYSSIKEIKATQADVATQLAEYKKEQSTLIETLATRDQVSGLITRIDKISSRLDEVIGVLMK